MAPGNGNGEEEIFYLFRHHHPERNGVGHAFVAEESVQVDAAILPLMAGVRVQGIMAGGDAFAVDGGSLPGGDSDCVVGGKEVSPLHPPALADIDLAGEMVVVGVLVCREPPAQAFLPERCRQGLVVLGEPQQAEGVVPEPAGEVVPPFPGGGRPGPVLFRQIGGDEGHMLVVGIGLSVGQLHHVGDSGDAFRIPGPVGSDTGVAALEYVLHHRGIFLPIVVCRLAYGHPGALVGSEAEAVVVGLHSVVPKISGPLGFIALEAVVGGFLPPPELHSPVAVDAAGARFAILGTPLTPYPVGDVGRGGQVSLVGSVYKHSGLILFRIPGLTVQYLDRQNLTAVHRDVCGIAVELPFEEDGHAVSALLQHRQEGFLGNGRFEVIAIAAIRQLTG